MKTFEQVLNDNNIGLGISGDDNYEGTWEWFNRETKEWEAGFDSEQEAYLSAREHLMEYEGIDLPNVDEDGDLIEN